MRYLVLVPCILLLSGAAAAQKQDPPIPADRGKVYKTESGLEYSILTTGDGGHSPRIGDTIIVKFTGWLPDGKVFNSTKSNAAPMRRKLGQCITGWIEGVGLMTRGARHKIKVPAALAYGGRGWGQRVPPDADLVFEVELIDFVKGPEVPSFRALPDDAKKTESGLRYFVEKAGKGAPPGLNDAIRLTFTYWTVSGEYLTSSLIQGSHISGSVEQLRFPFFKEAATMMKPGATYRFDVPPSILFGDRPQGPKLPPNSHSVWHVELTCVWRFAAPDTEPLVTPCGAKLHTLLEGKGESPSETDVANLHYAGWANGKLFHTTLLSSNSSGIAVSRCVTGFKEGLLRMQPGGLYRLEIPAEHAYADNPPPGSGVEKNARLVYVVELVGVAGR